MGYGDFLVPCGLGDLPMSIHSILNVLNDRMGRMLRVCLLTFSKNIYTL